MRPGIEPASSWILVGFVTSFKLFAYAVSGYGVKWCKLFLLRNYFKKNRFLLWCSGLRIQLQQPEAQVQSLEQGVKRYSVVTAMAWAMAWNPWPRTFHMTRVQPLKKEKENENFKDIFSVKCIGYSKCGKNCFGEYLLL